MSAQFARVPTDAGAVVREVRGFGGVPWGRLLRYLRPHWLPFSIALVGLVLSSALGLLFCTNVLMSTGTQTGPDGLPTWIYFFGAGLSRSVWWAPESSQRRRHFGSTISCG